MEFGWFELSLPVQDIATSVVFYGNLGFRQVDGGVPLRHVTLEKGDCRIALYQGHLDPARPQLIFWQGDVEAIARALEARGLEFEKPPAKDGAGGVGAMLRDPDGHPLYFVNLPGVQRERSD